MLNRASFVSVLSVSLAAAATPALAQLNGVYLGDQTSVCVTAPAGFNGNLALNGPGNIGSSMSAGQLTLYPDGTGTGTLRTLGIGHAATGTGATPATESQITCPFTYTYAPSNGNLVTITNGTCSGSNLTGPAAGQVSETTGIVSQWVLTNDGSKLVRVSTKPRVEHFHNLTSGFTADRICHRDGIFYFRNPARTL